MEDFTQALIGYLQTIAENVGMDLRSIVAVILIVSCLFILKFVILRLVWSKTDDTETRYRARKTVNSIFFISLVIIIVMLLFKAGDKIATYFGFLTVGLSLALQDIIKSIAGWIFIMGRRLFSVGDRIEIGDFKGDVIDIRLFHFSLMEIGNWVDADQSTGRVIHVPNNIILQKTVSNFGQGFQFIWNEIPILVTFESDWRKAKYLAMKIVSKHAQDTSKEAKKKMKEASKQFMIIYKNLTPTVYTSVKNSGVMLTIRYLVDPRSRRTSEEKIWEDILDAFEQRSNIEFAYPTQRFYNNETEHTKSPNKIESIIGTGEQSII